MKMTAVMITSINQARQLRCDHFVLKQLPAKVFDKTDYNRPEKKVILASVNEADTSAFIGLPGNASQPEESIVKFRDNRVVLILLIKMKKLTDYLLLLFKR